MSQVGMVPSGRAFGYPATADPTVAQSTHQFQTAIRNIVLSNAGWGLSQTGAITADGTSRIPFTAQGAFTDLRLLYTNVNAASGALDVDGPQTVFKASIEFAGTIYPVTFRGALTCTLDGGGMILSDALGIEVPAGATVQVRTYVSTTATKTNRFTNGTGTGGFTATTDLTAKGSGAIADSFSFVFTAAAIVGRPQITGAAPGLAQAGFLVEGDSVAAGTGDGIGAHGGVNALTGGGYIIRGLEGRAGTINISNNSDTLANAVLNTFRNRRIVSDFACTHAITQFGINDDGGTLAALQANALLLWTSWVNRGMKAVHGTIQPATTSIDNWLTVDGQTVIAGEAVRVGFNRWLRDGAPVKSAISLTPVPVGGNPALRSGQLGHPLAAMFDAAILIETAQDSGLWKMLPGRTVADGVVNTGVGAGFTYTSATAKFTAADTGVRITVVGAGAAGAVLSTYIQSVTDASTVTMGVAGSTNVSGASTTIGVSPTSDGFHPSAPAAAIMAAAVAGLVFP